MCNDTKLQNGTSYADRVGEAELHVSNQPIDNFMS